MSRVSHSNNVLFVFFMLISAALHFPIYSWASHFYFEKTPVPALIKKNLEAPSFKYVPVADEQKILKKSFRSAPESRNVKSAPLGPVACVLPLRSVKPSAGEHAVNHKKTKKKQSTDKKSAVSSKKVTTRKITAKTSTPELKPTVENIDLSNDVVRDAFMDYYDMLSSIIARFAVYPEEARTSKRQGAAYISFEMKRSGAVKEVVLRHSSGDAVLDNAALCAIRNASPFPPLPVAVKESAIRLNVPISFEIE